MVVIQSKPLPPVPTDFISQMGQTLASKLLESLGVSPTFLSACICTSLVSTIISFISSVYLISTSSEGRYFAFSIPLMANAISMISQLAAIVHTCTSFKFDVESATKAITEIMTFHSEKKAKMTRRHSISETHSNSWDWGALIKYAMKIIVVIVTAGLTRFGWSTSELNTFLTFNDKTTKLANDATDFVSDILVEAGIADLQGKAGTYNMYQKLLTTSQTLLTTNAGSFVTDVAQYSLLCQTITQINESLAKKMTESEVKQFSAIKTTLGSTLHKLVEIKSATDMILEGKTRIATYGFLFEGEPGVGKSDFAMHIMSKVARTLEIPDSVYDFKVTSSGKFSRPYGNEPLGIYNEFANVTGADPQTANLNSVISSDPYSFESAFIKEQPCKLRVVSLTSNRKDYGNLLQTLSEPSVCALFSRLIRVEVTDPLYKGRFAENNHRTPNFTHLTLTLKVPSVEHPQHLNDLHKTVNSHIGIEDLTNKMVKQCAQAEIYHFQKILETLPSDDVKVPILQSRISFCRGLLDGLAGSSTACAAGSFCTVRLQGGVGAFKSTTIQSTANQLNKTFGMPVYTISRVTDIPKLCPEAAIYIFDDFCFQKYYQEYLDFTNSINMNSIILIGTNHVVRYEKTSRFGLFHFRNACNQAFLGTQTTQLLNPFSSSFFLTLLLKFIVFLFFAHPPAAYYPTESNLHLPLVEVPGLVRRLGFMTRVVDSGVVTNLPTPSGLCFTVQENGTYTTTDNQYYPQDVPDVICDHYMDFMLSHKEIPIVTTVAPVFEPDVQILIKDFSLWKEAVKTVEGYAQMYLKKDQHAAGSVIVKPEMESIFLSQAQLNYWLIPNLESIEDIEPVVRTLCNTLRNAIPGISVVVSAEEFSYSYYKGLIYSRTELSRNIEVQVDGFNLVYNGKIVPAVPIFQFIENPALLHELPPLHIFHGRELGIIKAWIQSNNTWRTLPLYSEAQKLIQDNSQKQKYAAKHPLLTAFNQTPLATKIVTGVLGIFSTAGLVYFLYNMFKPTSKDPQTVSNVSSNPETLEKLEQYQARYVAGVKDNKYQNPEDFKEQLRQEQVDQKEIDQWERYLDDIRSACTRSNAKETDNVAIIKDILDSLRLKDTKAAQHHLDKFNSEHKLSLKDIEAMCHITSNAVPPSEEISAHNSVVQTFSKVLRSACFRISNKTRGGACYGLLIKDKYFVTVSHLFDKGDELAVFWAGGSNPEGREWPAKILLVNRALDLAIGFIDDKTFPASKNLTSHLLHGSSKRPFAGNCYYIRPFSNVFVYSGSGVRHQFNNITRYDSTNPLYCPQDYYTYTWSQLFDAADIFSLGDCGLPLVAVIEGKAMILGIHNGFSKTGVAFFSPVHATIFKSLHLAHEETISNCSKPSILYKEKVLDLPSYNDAILPGELEKPTKWDNLRDTLDILGHSQKLYYFSNPKYGKKNLHNEQCRLWNPSLPATMKTNITPEAAKVLVKDRKGRPHALMTQAVKFGGKPDLKYDPELLEQACKIQHNVYAAVLNPLKILRPAAAVNGLLGESLKAVVLTTSPGPDIKRLFKLNDKTKIFKNVKPEGEVPWYVFTDHEAAQKVQLDMTAILDNWSGGVQTAIFSKDNPKIELLPKEKVEQEGKVRLFCELDLAVNLVIKRLLGDFMSQVNESHFLLNVKTGINFYRDLHWAAKSHIADWDKFGFDVKRMDKYLPAILVRKFFLLVESLLQDRDKTTLNIYEAASASISNRIHILEGLLYRVSRGNPSGLVGTNHINALSLELIVIYGLLKQYRQISPDTNFITNTQYMDLIRGFLNGDNGYITCPPSLGFDEGKINSFFKDFGMEVIFDKSSLDGIEWCGREIKIEDGFLFPALRKEAIVRQIFWVKPTETLDYPLQCTLIQMEAALHDEKFFKDVQHDIRIIAKLTVCNPHSIQYMDYKTQRHHFKQYIAGSVSSPVSTGQLPECLFPLKALQPIMETINWVGKYNERCVRDKLPTNPISNAKQDKETLTWFDTVTDEGFVGEGSGVRKSIAKNNAYSVLYENRFGSSAETVSNADRKLHKHSIRYTNDITEPPYKNTVRIYSDEKLVLTQETRMTPDRVSAAVRSHMKDADAWSGALYAHEQFSGSSSSTSNADRRTHPPASDQTVPTGGAAVAQPASQLTSTIGQLEPPPMSVVASGGVSTATVLNPFGPVNRLTEGGITVDYPTLVYSQLMDSSQTLHVTDSMPAGTIVAQIPWDPLGSYVNKYVRQYVSMHGRCNGDLIYRITLMSNQTFSGGLMVFWHHRKWGSGTVDREDAQKIAFQVLTMEKTATSLFVMKDARQYEYYRTLPLNETDNIPHIVIAVYSQIKSPLIKGISCDIIVGSRLASPMDRALGANPFVVADPLVGGFAPSPTPDSLNGRSIGTVFPSYSLKYLTLALDGRTTLPELAVTLNGVELFFDMRTLLPCLYGGSFMDNVNKRLFSVHVTTSTIGTDEVRLVFVLTRCTPLEEQTIATNPDFVSCAEGDDWLSKASNMSWLRSVIPINTARNNPVSLNLYTKDNTKIDLVQQTSFVGLRGHGFVQCYIYTNPVNSLGAAANIGIPNSTQPTRTLIPHNPVLGPMISSDGLLTLPSRWAKTIFTTQSLGVVTGNNEIAPTCIDDPVFIKFFQDRSVNLTDVECLQFKLLEPTTQTTVAIIRYIHTLRSFVMLPIDNVNYKIYASDASSLVFDEVSVVRTTSGFDPTDTTAWLSRFPATFFQGRALAVSNAAFAALAPEVLLEGGAMGEGAAVEGGFANIHRMDAAMNEMEGAVQDFSIPPPPISQTLPLNYNRFENTSTMNVNRNYNTYNTYNTPEHQGSKLNDFLLYGVAAPLISSTISNGQMINTPAQIINGNSQAQKNRDFTSQQNELQREHDQLMQEQQNAANQQMQNNAFAHDTAIEQEKEQYGLNMENQKEMFTHQENISNYTHQDAMQRASFSHSDTQQQAGFAHDIEMESEHFTHGLINTATGGAFDIANTLVNKAGDALLEHQRYNDQNQLMAENAKLNVQAAGQTSQALQISNHQ